MSKAVVFDVGNVLLEWNPRHLYRKLLPDEKAVDHFLGTVCTPAWNVEQDRGRPWHVAVDELSRQFPEYADLIRAYDERWHETLGGPIEGAVKILRELCDAEVPLYALTNFSTEKFAGVRETYDFFDLFEGIVVSGAERVVKPDPAIFHILFERYPATRSNAVFIDDSTHNVDAAAMLGMRAVHFKDSEALRAQLRELDLPV